jgi:hypothetical protein
MQFSGETVGYPPTLSLGSAMFHRRCPQQAPDAHFICAANALAETET